MPVLYLDMDARIEKVIRYLEDHIESDFSVGMLADFACLSPHYFFRLFRKETGYPPHKFITHLKMKNAYRMITSSASPAGAANA